MTPDLTKAFSAPASLATRYEAGIGAAMLASLRPKPVKPADGLTDLQARALAVMGNRPWTTGDLMNRLGTNADKVRYAMLGLKDRGLVTVEEYRDAGKLWHIWQAVREAGE